ncbi:MAG: ABC transporter permease [Flavobacteriales bacterium]|nr:MAG: ABC transporter permease [Flavobacteriales bacterium]
MLRRIAAHIRKELLLLVRDRGGLALLYLMPMALVTIMAVVQDAPFRDFRDKQMSVLFVDNDGQGVGARVREGLRAAGPFTVHDAPEGMAGEAVREVIRKGEHQVAVIVPARATATLNAGSATTIATVFSPGDSTGIVRPDTSVVLVILDPTVKQAFRELVNSHLAKILGEITSDRLLNDMGAQIAELTGTEAPQLKLVKPILQVGMTIAGAELSGDRVAENSTQHNVPAWTIFAMFFIVVLLAGNMVKERSAGIMTRLLTMPGGAGERIAARMVSYLLVCVSQAVLLLLMGVFILPLLGLAALDLHGVSLLLLLLVCIAVGAAATSFGLAAGAVSSTQQRSAVFGSTAVVILSAIGGIWVPLYIMPEAMKAIGRLSPLNWSMEAFNGVLLRHAPFGEVAVQLAPLFLFTLICLAFAILAERRMTRR